MTGQQIEAIYRAAQGWLAEARRHEDAAESLLDDDDEAILHRFQAATLRACAETVLGILKT